MGIASFTVRTHVGKGRPVGGEAIVGIVGAGLLSGDYTAFSRDCPIM